MKIKKKNCGGSVRGGGGGFRLGGGGSGLGGGGGVRVVVNFLGKFKKKRGVVGLGVRVDVNEALKFL